MKTILLTIPRGVVARNLLENNFYELIRNRYRIVMLTPAAQDPVFVARFSHPNVKFLEFKEISHSRTDAFFVGLQKYLAYSHFTGLKTKYGIRGVSKPGDESGLRYYVYSIIFWPLSRIILLRDLVRWFDYRWGQKKTVARCLKIIKTYQPDLVISTSLLSNIETALVKAARRAGVLTIGMPKSWDNLSKSVARVKPDILVVWSEFMFEQAIKWQNVTREQIKIIGIPQFDIYADKARLWSKERFVNEFKLNPQKKIVLYTSGGKGIPEDRALSTIVYEELMHEQPSRAQLLIRPHFKYPNDADKFFHLQNLVDVQLDQANVDPSTFRDHADYSMLASERLMNMLYHSDIVINTASTINLDAAALNKPIINLALSEVIGQKPPGATYLMFYHSDYIQSLLAVRASLVVSSRQELRTALKSTLTNVAAQQKEREELVRRFCYKVDGCSGQRLAKLVEECLERTV